MYYCKKRYYVPHWRRWLTPDNPKFLGLSNINNLNLFVYCGNNPTMHFDLSGNIYVSVEDPRISKEKMLVKADSNHGTSYGPIYSPSGISPWTYETFLGFSVKDRFATLFDTISSNYKLLISKFISSFDSLENTFYNGLMHIDRKLLEYVENNSDIISEKAVVIEDFIGHFNPHKEGYISEHSYLTNTSSLQYNAYNYQSIRFHKSDKVFGGGFKVYFEQIDYENEEEDLFPMW